MTEIIRGHKFEEKTREGDAYYFTFTMYVDSQELPISFRIDERHTADAYTTAKAEILRHENEVGGVSHAWLTRVDMTSTDCYREAVFEYFRGRWTLY